MKVFKLFVIVCLVLFVSTMMVDARSYITGMNWDVAFTLPYPTIGNDFHVKGKVLSGNNVMPTKRAHWNYDYSNFVNWNLTGYSISQNASNPNEWDFSMDFRIGGGLFVFNGARCHFGVEFKTERYNSIVITELYWTRDGVNIGNANVLGFHAWERPYGPYFSLENASAVAIDVAEMQFAVTDIAVPLEAMARNDIGLPGTAPNKAYADIKWVNYPEKLRVEPKKSVEINLTELGIRLAEGQFLQVRYVNPATGDGTWVQHQHTIEVE